jgi:AraC family transcriptional regulator
MPERAQAAASTDIGASASGQQEARARAIARAIAHIERHFREPLTLGGIATVAHVSKFHFARLFRREVRMSPMQYVRWRRILEAQRLLRAGHLPMTLIATGLGFFDQSHFSRAFRAATGLTPYQYASRRIGEREAGSPEASLPHLSPATPEHPCPCPLTPPSTTTA